MVELFYEVDNFCQCFEGLIWFLVRLQPKVSRYELSKGQKYLRTLALLDMGRVENDLVELFYEIDTFAMLWRVNLIASLIAYSYPEQKPSLNLHARCTSSSYLVLLFSDAIA
jgi:hypothetical protein